MKNTEQALASSRLYPTSEQRMVLQHQENRADRKEAQENHQNSRACKCKTASDVEITGVAISVATCNLTSLSVKPAG